MGNFQIVCKFCKMHIEWIYLQWNMPTMSAWHKERCPHRVCPCYTVLLCTHWVLELSALIQCYRGEFLPCVNIYPLTLLNRNFIQETLRPKNCLWCQGVNLQSFRLKINKLNHLLGMLRSQRLWLLWPRSRTSVTFMLLLRLLVASGTNLINAFKLQNPIFLQLIDWMHSIYSVALK